MNRRLAFLVVTGIVLVATPNMAMARPDRRVTPPVGADQPTDTDQTTTTVRPGRPNIPTSMPLGKRVEERLTQAKTRGEQEINRRLATLDRLTRQVQQVKRLSSGNRSALLAELNTARAGLSALLTEIEGDTDLVTLKEDLRSIVDDYRVYVFLVPKVHLIVAADAMLAIATKFDEIKAKLQTLIDKAAATGSDTSAAEAALAALEAAVEAAEASATSVISDVLPLDASSYPSNKGTIASARDKLRSARQSLNEARKQAKAAIDGLRPSEEPTAPT